MKIYARVLYGIVLFIALGIGSYTTNVFAQTTPIPFQASNENLLTEFSTVQVNTNKNKQMSDLIILPGGSSTINVYDADRNRIKTIMADSHILIDGVRIPERIQLSTYGLQGYTLKMALISADKILQK